MRILNNLIVTGSISTNRFIGFSPVSFSAISGTISQLNSELGIWSDEYGNLRKYYSGSDYSSPCDPIGGYGKPVLSGSNCQDKINLYNCIVSSSMSQSAEYNLTPGTYTVTSSFAGGSTQVVSGSLRKYTISGSNTSAGDCIVGSIQAFISPTGDTVNDWSGFVLNGYDKGMIDIWETVAAQSGSCSPETYLNSNTASNYVNLKVSQWAAILCKCLPSFGYVDISFTLRYVCNFPDINLGNNRVTTKTFTFRVYKARNTCSICPDPPIKKRSLFGDSGVNDVISGLLHKQESTNEVSVYNVNYLKLPSSEFSADSYYDFNNKTGSLTSSPGLLYFNESNSSVYVYSGTSWVSIGGSGGISRSSTQIGNDSASIFVVTHNKGTRDVIVSVRETTAPYEIVFPTVKAATTNTITVDFGGTIPSANEYTVVVI